MEFNTHAEKTFWEAAVMAALRADRLGVADIAISQADDALVARRVRMVKLEKKNPAKPA